MRPHLGLRIAPEPACHKTRGPHQRLLKGRARDQVKSPPGYALVTSLGGLSPIDSTIVSSGETALTLTGRHGQCRLDPRQALCGSESFTRTKSPHLSST